jgi:formylglycine-generating enzyme required for sulfatase activity
MLITALLAAAVAATQPVPTGRVAIPAGSYLPLYAATATTRIHVSAFQMDREPVTRAAFLTFVRATPAWRRGGAAAGKSEAGYLRDWRTPLDPGAATLNEPVTDVSRNAAAAFCAARGGRLPSTDEWEYAAAASTTKRDAVGDPAFASHLLAVYSARAGRPVAHIRDTRPNAFGVSHMHDLIWEWTAPSSQHAHKTMAASMTPAEHMACAAASDGATDPSNYAGFLRYAFRSGLGDRSTVHTLGFRCVY